MGTMPLELTLRLKDIKYSMSVDAAASHDEIYLFGGGDIDNKIPGHHDVPYADSHARVATTSVSTPVRKVG
jgi:hypothetical protein